MQQFHITATRSWTYYKTVWAKDLTDAHLQAFETPEDPEDDWYCEHDPDFDDEIPYVITNIEEEQECE